MVFLESLSQHGWPDYVKRGWVPSPPNKARAACASVPPFLYPLSGNENSCPNNKDDES